jgi:DNA mismatch repair protein MutS
VGKKLTPMMKQYLEVKERHPDSMLFFRLGDFYELFFEDAEVASRELGITLTARNKGKSDVPMAGVPHHSADSYINQLIEKGFSVAICEQVEDADQASGIVKRDVVRVVTPGVVLDTETLDDKSPNYVASISVSGEGAQTSFGVAYLDVSTGDFRATEVSRTEELAGELNRIEPREVLVEREHEDLFDGVQSQLEGVYFRPRDAAKFEPKTLLERVSGGPRLAEDLDNDAYFLDASALEKMFSGVHEFGFRTPDLVQRAVTATLEYVVETQRGVPSNVRTVDTYHAQSFLVIDESTKANLELTRTLMGGRRSGSLLSIIDKTVTAMGGRRLRQWLNYPLVDVERIERRLDAVEEMVRFPAIRQDVREALDEVYDIERLCGKVSSGTANARDLRSLLSTLSAIPDIEAILRDCESEYLVELEQSLDPCEEIRDLIDRALVEEPPVELTEGGLFDTGYHDELDELIEVSEHGKDWILRYETEQKEATDISSLKVKHNKVFGYFIEVTKANLHLVPDEYIRKQTLANSERYYTPELKEMEDKILGAEEKRKALEYELFQELRERVGLEIGDLLRTASDLANLDVISGLAELAQRLDYARPTITDDATLEIEEGRHPVVERTLQDEEFVPNSVEMDPERRLLIITGPNMAGKSTVIRQVALITLLGQLGSFVPAKSARIGAVDKIFSRVGASDNLARGQSTFMVEMTEAAHILNNATERSLVILDEIGRGTSTFDGLSIAWAVAEHLHDELRAKTLFATHYHELTELTRTLDAAANMSIAVKEWQDDIIFLRKLVDGEANRSYGIQVGRLAGLPEPVVERAKQVLENLESGQFDEMGIPMPGRKPDEEPTPTRHHNPNQMTLFASGARLDPAEEEALERLREANVNHMTPIEAMKLLDELVEDLRE